MYTKENFIPDSEQAKYNFLVYHNAKIIKDDQEPLKDIEPKLAEDPNECYKYCEEIGSICNIVEYHNDTKLCYFYDLPKDDHVTLKFKYTDKELQGESFSTSTYDDKFITTDISKEECINLFEKEPDGIFYHYKEDGSYTECSIGVAKTNPNFNFGINLNSFNAILNPNVKFQENELNKAGTTEQQQNGADGNNFVPLLLVGCGIVGVVIITSLIVYGIKMIKKANEQNHGNSRNARNQVSYKIKNSDPYSVGSNGYNKASSGSKGSTLNNSLTGGRSQHSQLSLNYNRSQHSNISNIAPEVYDYSYNESNTTYLNNSVQNTTLQEFYQNASLGSSYNHGHAPINNNLQEFYQNASLGGSYGTSPSKFNRSMY